MRQSFTIPIPPTFNEQIRLARAHWTKSAAAKKKHDRRVAKAVEHLRPYEKGPLYLTFHWQVKTRASDGDGVLAAQKYIFDGMQLGGLIPQDNLKAIPGPYISTFDKGPNTVTVTIADSPIVLLAIIPDVPT